MSIVMTITSQQDVEKELIAITTKLLADSGEPYRREIKLDASLQRHLGIDSLGRAELFQRIEKTFDIRISDRLLAEAETLADIVNYLHEAGPSLVIRSKHEMITSHGEKLNIDPSEVTTLLDILILYGEK